MAQLRDGLKLQRMSTPEGVASALREAIINGDLEMGASLNEKVLCERLGVSRTPLREALFDLQGNGLVQIIPYRGAFVFDMCDQEFKELGAFRAVLEKAALLEVAAADPKGLCDELRALVGKMKDSIGQQNREGYGALDTQYHEAIIQRSANRYLIDAYRRVGLRLAALRHRIQHDATTVRNSLDTHEKLVVAIEEGRAEEALALIDLHIDGGMRFFRKGIEEIRKSAPA